MAQSAEQRFQHRGPQFEIKFLGIISETRKYKYFKQNHSDFFLRWSRMWGSYFFNNLTKPGIFLLFLSFFSIQIWLFKSLDGLLGFRTRDPRMVGGDWAMMCLIFEAYCVRNKFGQTFRPDRGLLHHLKLHEKFVLGWLVRLVITVWPEKNRQKSIKVAQKWFH